MRQLHNVLTASCGLMAIAISGCINVATHPRSINSFDVRMPDGTTPQRFAVMQCMCYEQAHRFEDPPKHDYSVRRKAVRIALCGSQSCSMPQEAYTRLWGVGLPFLSLVGGSWYGYLIIAEGAEVGRLPDTVTEDTVESEGAVKQYRRVFKLTGQVDTLSNLNGMSGADLIVDDLESEGIWLPLQARWKAGRDLAAIRYACEYYTDRYAKIRAANAAWSPSERIQKRIAWMESVVRADVEPPRDP